MDGDLHDATSHLIQRAARLAVDSRLGEATTALQELDGDALWTAREARKSETAAALKAVPASQVHSNTRGSVPLSVVRAVNTRDGYVCRYCGRLAVEIEVLKTLSKLFPVAFPYHSAWKRGECTPVYWTHVASLEHLVPVTHGGSDDPDTNLICACYECNDARSNALLEDLGWEPRQRNRDDWDGLLPLLEPLRALLKTSGPVESPPEEGE